MVGSKLERYPLFGPFLLKEKEPSLCRDIHRLQSREPRHHWRMRNCARWQALYRFSHSRYMAWRGAAATAQNVHLPLLSPLPHQRCGLFGHFVIRSEEHTSELQSLMRRSYAVFCLKKKNTIIIFTIITSLTTY